MRVVLNDKGYIEQWILEDDAGYMTENDIIIEAPEEANDIASFREMAPCFHIVDGKLVKDENRKAELETERKHRKNIVDAKKKIALFMEAFGMDEEPEYVEGYKYVPYFDKENMKFAWKLVADDEG